MSAATLGLNEPTAAPCNMIKGRPWVTDRPIAREDGQPFASAPRFTFGGGVTATCSLTADGRYAAATLTATEVDTIFESGTPGFELDDPSTGRVWAYGPVVWRSNNVGSGGTGLQPSDGESVAVLSNTLVIVGGGDFAPTDHDHVLADISDYTAPDLSGLVQDTDPRLSDARPPTVHDHDDRYYTEAEVDQLLAGTVSGTGSPLGVVPAPPGTKYIDQNGTFGAWEWIKTSGTGTTGWEVSHGDTGWVDATHLLTGLSPDNEGTLKLRRLPGGIVRARFTSLLLESGNGYGNLASGTLPSWARAEAHTLLHVFRHTNTTLAQQLVVSSTSLTWLSEWSLVNGVVTRDRPSAGITGIVQWATHYPWPTTLP